MSIQVVTRRGLVDSEWLDVIKERDRLLIEADELVNTAVDNGFDPTEARQWRQGLRDIPETYSNPKDVVWPTKPSLPSA